MLTFNLLLKEAGIDPKQVYLVRHQDTRVSKAQLRAHNSSPYDLWMNQPGQFERYQQLQREKCFDKRDIVASFVVTPRKETLFAGLYRKSGIGKLPDDLHECPVRKLPVSDLDHIYYLLDREDRLADLIGRLIIDWGNAYLAWIQRADVVEEKSILEIRRERIKDEAFPGYREFQWNIADIQSIWPSWQDPLSRSKGIYLLTCKDTGKHYVGKADGEGGFWGRFCNYAENGHGGNEGMKKHSTSGYSVTILEALATPTQGEIDRLESLWKDKLASRKWGLNEN
ncbi:MAG: GIY-YIG nuclease family protein [Acidobacteriota bacterium]